MISAPRKAPSVHTIEQWLPASGSMAKGPAGGQLHCAAAMRPPMRDGRDDADLRIDQATHLMPAPF
jgi:hypothetical protein